MRTNNSTKGKVKGRGVTQGEIAVQKSPAEFFAENQAIAGFDNMGKSLFTTIRELVENALDACESIDQLPEISVEVTEYTQAQFNKLAGLGESPRKNQKDSELFQKKKGRKSSASSSEKINDDYNPGEEAAKEDVAGESTKKKGKGSRVTDAYFRVKVQDNGCGMSHEAIPNLLGRVLSGSKYGVRQTRGKFGLGAKMALIWSKKSSGQPVRIVSAHRPNAGDHAPTVSTCVLDIDIYKNQPRILEHEQEPNTEGSVGTTFEVLIAGNWTTYKSRVVQYMQQLAIITPYAALELSYCNATDPKRNMKLTYDRRSEQMPPAAATIKHHPASVNNLVVQQLVRFTRAKTLVKFLSSELSAVSPTLAKRLIAEVASEGLEESTDPADLTDKQVTRLVQLLRQVQLFKAPDGSCLSPLGEYNLNLGIRKVLEPDLIATARDKPGAYEGHPFVVEAAVSLGGKDVKEGLTVIRFANRIPLLFEGGADVSTRVAQTKIRWSNYKIDHKRDKVGVFVSIVSTKVPFKGTSKEYIGDDATEIQLSVKRALQSCCQQLRAQLMKRNALKDAKERKSRLVKYVPDVSRSLFGLLDGMKKRKSGLLNPRAAPSSSPTKRLRLDESAAHDMIKQMDRGLVTETKIQKLLFDTINEQQDALDEEATSSRDIAKAAAQPIFLVPLFNMDDPSHDVCNPALFTFRPIRPLPFFPSPSEQE